MKKILIVVALLTITSNAVAAEVTVCTETTTFESAADGSTVIVTKTTCEVKNK